MVKWFAEIAESMSEEQQAYTTAKYLYTVVSRKKSPPPFAILALVQNTEGLINAGCDNFFRDYNLPAGCWWGLGPSTRCR